MNANHSCSPAMLVTAVLAAGFAAGCGSSAGPPRAAVHGKVTVGDQPLSAGQIMFIPVAPNAGPAASAAIVNGEYKLEEREGPLVGKNRVEVRGERPLGIALDDEQGYAQRGGAPLPPDPIPALFNSQSTLYFEVVADHDNSYDVPLPMLQQTTGQY